MKQQVKTISEELVSLRKQRTQIFLNKMSKPHSRKLSINTDYKKKQKQSFLKNVHKFSSGLKSKVEKQNRDTHKLKKFVKIGFREKYFCKTNYSNRQETVMTENCNASLFSKKRLSQGFNRTQETNVLKPQKR